MTAADRRMLEWIAHSIRAHGWPPSVREIARGLDLAPSVTHRRLRRLEEAGLLERLPRTPRALRLSRHAIDLIARRDAEDGQA